jgi:hypothetical protein
VVVAGVLLAAAVAGLSHRPLPFGLGLPPLGLGIVGSDRPGAVAYALWQAIVAHPALVGEAIALAGAAAVLPLIRRRGPWPVACFGAGMLALTLLQAPGGGAVALVAGTWLTCAALILDSRRPLEGGR